MSRRQMDTPPAVTGLISEFYFRFLFIDALCFSTHIHDALWNALVPYQLFLKKRDEFELMVSLSDI